MRADELARRRRGRSASLARTPSSGRSASCDEGRRGREGGFVASRRTCRARGVGRFGRPAGRTAPPARSTGDDSRRGRLPPRPASRIVVVSPHLDDGVLSLGASIASWARQGASVELLTVLACDPDSTAPAGGWDRRGGFATEGESARGRREEDRRHALRSARRRCGSRSGAWTTTDTATRLTCATLSQRHFVGADSVLCPGLPLTHPDHAWLASILDEDVLGTRRVAATPSSRTPCARPPIPPRALRGSHALPSVSTTGSRSGARSAATPPSFPSSGCRAACGRPSSFRGYSGVGRLVAGLTSTTA